MSPIGRVFIVLNLALAGGFAVVSGTYLQKQHNFKTKWEAEKADKEKVVAEKDRELDLLRSERNTLETQKTTFENQLAAANNQIAGLQDENKRLSGLTSSQEATLKQLLSQAEAANSQAKAAFDQARDAYQASIQAGNERNEAVNLKNAAEAENRALKNDIAALNGTIKDKDVQIASLERETSEQKLLVQAATVNGFLPGMAAPNLTGTVTNASGRLCTISITDNPGNVDIQDQIERRPFRFAIFDDKGFKAEAVATKYEASAKAVLCNVLLTNGSASIKTGDSASTKP